MMTAFLILIAAWFLIAAAITLGMCVVAKRPMPQPHHEVQFEEAETEFAVVENHEHEESVRVA